MMTNLGKGDKVRIMRQERRDCTANAKIGGVATILDGFDGEHYPVEYQRNSCGTQNGWITPSSIAPYDDSGERLSEAEAKIAALEAEVASLKKASKGTEITNTLVIGSRTVEVDVDRIASELYAKLGKVQQTLNQRRADVIMRAQAFVAKKYKPHWNDSGDKVIGFKGNLYRPEFVVNAEKCTVAVIMRRYGGGIIDGKAVAKCAPDDIFNADIGKAIALGRALGVKVPKEFYNAPQPTEVVVGMRVKGESTGAKYEVDRFYYEQKLDGKLGRAFSAKGFAAGEWLGTAQVTITDDSNAVYL